MEWIATILTAFCVIWVRMAFHYLGQYVFLKIVGAPVTSVVIKWYKIKLSYSYWNVFQQLGVVVTGTLSNTLVFLFLISVCHICQKYIYCFPVSFCKIIAWYGLATCLDFLLVNTIDMANQETDGDLLKLYNYYERT